MSEKQGFINSCIMSIIYLVISLIMLLDDYGKFNFYFTFISSILVLFVALGSYKIYMLERNYKNEWVYVY